MQTNKFQLERYRIIRDVLSVAPASVEELTDEVNRRLAERGFAIDAPVSRRTVQTDLKRIEEVFGIEIISERRGHKMMKSIECGRDLLSRRFTDDETAYLRELLAVMGHFEGLGQFEALTSLKKELSVREAEAPVLDFGMRDMDSRYLPELFSHIRRRNIIVLEYVTNADPDRVRSVELKPYLLRHYEGSWWLAGADVRDDFILVFPLDHIRGVSHSYRGCYGSVPAKFLHYFDSIVGVSLPKGTSSELVEFWVDDSFYPYLDRKPFHWTLDEIASADRCRELREKFSLPEGGHLMQMECVVNRELIQLLGSCLDYVVVLSPESLRRDMEAKIERLYSNYHKV